MCLTKTCFTMLIFPSFLASTRIRPFAIDASSIVSTGFVNKTFINIYKKNQNNLGFIIILKFLFNIRIYINHVQEPDLPFSQSWLSQPSSHLHVYDPLLFIQVPLFWQGPSKHSFRSTKKKNQIYDLSYTVTFAGFEYLYTCIQNIEGCETFEYLPHSPYSANQLHSYIDRSRHYWCRCHYSDRGLEDTHSYL